jgi:hypothetical protein
LLSNAIEEKVKPFGFVQATTTTSRVDKKRFLFKSFYSKINKKKDHN